MCESERFQNVKGCLLIGATDSPKTHRGEGESPTPLDSLDRIKEAQLIRDLTNQATFFIQDLFHYTGEHHA
jgi:hypothetical protein